MNSLFSRPKDFLKFFLPVCLLLLPFTGQTQNPGFARTVIDTLITPYMAGRGYVEEGHNRSAAYIAAVMQELGLQPLTDERVFPENYFQHFSLAVNTFPAALSLEIDGKTLAPGLDYHIHPNSGGISETTLPLFFIPEKAIKSVNNFRKFLQKADYRNKAVVIFEKEYQSDEQREIYAALASNILKAPVVITVQAGLIWSVGRRQYDYVHMQVKEDVFPANAKEIRLNAEAAFNDIQTQNVIGWIPGKTQPDSFIYIVGHYDHLGMMGREAYFPGANDNASGIGLILDLARHYAMEENRPEYSIVFIAFGAEEAGLVGSKYYTENPEFPLEHIVMVLNLDLMGTGEDGITVVNATVFPDHFEGLKSINDRKNYLPAINSRGKAANSDHHFFTEKGIPSFFFYMLGPYKHYHNVHDKGPLSLAGYKGLFKLILDYNTWLQNRE